MSKRHVRFEKVASGLTCRGFCTLHTPITVVRESLFKRFLQLFEDPKIAARNSRILERQWTRVRGDIEGNDTPLSPYSIGFKFAMQRERRWAA